MIKDFERAARIIALDPYTAADNDETPETVSEHIKYNPAAVIDFLLDYIDNLQE